MNPLFSLVIPFDDSSRTAAMDLASLVRSGSAQVVLVGPGASQAPVPKGVLGVEGLSTQGDSLRAALAHVSAPITVLLSPDPAYGGTSFADVTAPILSNQADAVFATRASSPSLPDRALSGLTQLVTRTVLHDPATGVRAFRTSSLKALSLQSSDEAIDSEIIVKLSAQMCRFAEVAISAPRTPSTLRSQLARARALVRYGTTHNDTDNQHEGYNTLARMETAPRYNAWIGRRIRPHLGPRVLEVGAGIGTITEQIEPGRELVIALEVDPFYVDRLKNRFRDKPHVRPYLSGVELADWERLHAERIDSIVLSNVLEHIEDDAGAVRNFRHALQPGGKLIVLVPALPALFGSMDEAVGHFRRYTPATLTAALEAGGFQVETLEWMNLVGIPGWFVNSRVLKKRAVPPFQLRAYDALAPLLAEAEARVKLPVGMSLFAVARAP